MSSRKFIEYVQDQDYLVPPSLLDWLPKGHLAFFISDVVEGLDLAEWEAAYASESGAGEILKGHVTLGSLRVRQDYLIAQGLVAPFKKGDEDAEALQEMALARLRQLAAHEVGHTLGSRTISPRLAMAGRR